MYLYYYLFVVITIHDKKVRPLDGMVDLVDIKEFLFLCVTIS